MIDQLNINGTYSYDGYKASLKERRIKQPKKKSIKATVPFSNVTHDFSAINGEVYWEERELEYDFEILASSPEELETLKVAFANWVMNIAEQNLFDPFFSNYHHIVTFADMDFADDESVEKTTATVKFTAYPYKIANSPTTLSFNLGAATADVVAETSGVIVNNSAHRITPTITTDKAVTISIGDISYSIGAGTTTDEIIKLAVGNNPVTIQNANTEKCVVTFSFYEEVF